MSGLTTHVLNLVQGRPAAGVTIRLFARQHAVWIASGAAQTDPDGRARLLAGDAFPAGTYRLEFDIGPYFRASGITAAEPGFLETVAIEFHVGDAGAHHHVPLLVSPFGYSTYRGS
jgi:5-hydroxyisourate hydrolase